MSNNKENFNAYIQQMCRNERKKVVRLEEYNKNLERHINIQLKAQIRLLTEEIFDLKRKLKALKDVYFEKQEEVLRLESQVMALGG
jgi:hypothetical protein